MEIETTIIRINGSAYMRIPPVLLKHLQIEGKDTKAIVQDEKGKHGNYFSAWKKREQE